jgi:hypothetical protein
LTGQQQLLLVLELCQGLILLLGLSGQQQQQTTGLQLQEC